MTRSEAREIAFKSIFAYLNNSENFDMALTIEIACKGQNLDVESHKYITSILNSLIEHFDDIKILIETNSKEFVYDRIYKVDLALLFLAIIEIKHIKTPIKVAINETINLSKIFSTDDSPKYINGVLANIVKGLDE